MFFIQIKVLKEFTIKNRIEINSLGNLKIRKFFKIILNKRNFDF